MSYSNDEAQNFRLQQDHINFLKRISPGERKFQNISDCRIDFLLWSSYNQTNYIFHKVNMSYSNDEAQNFRLQQDHINFLKRISPGERKFQNISDCRIDFLLWSSYNQTNYIFHKVN